MLILLPFIYFFKKKYFKLYIFWFLVVFSFEFPKIVLFYKTLRFVFFTRNFAEAMQNKNTCNSTSNSNFTDKNVYNLTSSYENKLYYEKEQKKYQEGLKSDSKVFLKSGVKTLIMDKTLNPKIIKEVLASNVIKSASMSLVTN